MDPRAAIQGSLGKTTWMPQWSTPGKYLLSPTVRLQRWNQDSGHVSRRTVWEGLTGKWDDHQWAFPSSDWCTDGVCRSRSPMSLIFPRGQEPHACMSWYDLQSTDTLRFVCTIFSQSHVEHWIYNRKGPVLPGHVDPSKPEKLNPGQHQSTFTDVSPSGHVVSFQADHKWKRTQPRPSVDVDATRSCVDPYKRPRQAAWASVIEFQRFSSIRKCPGSGGEVVNYKPTHTEEYKSRFTKVLAEEDIILNNQSLRQWFHSEVPFG